MKRTNTLNAGGQTLIALLIFMALAVVITITAATITIVNLQANNAYSSGELALGNAQTGAENALEQLERNPNYGGETMTLANGNATITVSGTGTKTIVSVGKNANFSRTITATVTYAANIITLTNWVESP